MVSVATTSFKRFSVLSSTKREQERAAAFGGIRANDTAAWSEIVRENTPRMMCVARQLLRCEHESADAVQEAFVSAFRSLDSFEGNASLSTWLHRIVVNACLMKLRTKSRRPTVSIDQLLPKFDEAGRHTEPLCAWPARGEPDEFNHDLREKVRECIDQLPEAYRTVLILRDLGGFDTEQTACVLRMTPTNVKVRLHRARMALRTLLSPYVETSAN